MAGPGIMSVQIVFPFKSVKISFKVIQKSGVIDVLVLGGNFWTC